MAGAKDKLPKAQQSDHKITASLTLPNAEVVEKVNSATGIVSPTFQEAVLGRSEDVSEVAGRKWEQGENRVVASLSNHQITHKKSSDKLKGPTQTTTEETIYQITRTKLGKGTYKIVFTGEKTSSGEKREVAYAKTLKTLEQMSDSERKSFVNEVQILWELRGRPEFMQLEHAVVYQGKHGQRIGLMLESCNGGDLQKTIMEGNFFTNLDNHITLFSDILNGLIILEEKGIQHRDFKGDNVFLTVDESGKTRAKIGDFGLSKKVSGEERETVIKGSPYNVSPSYVRGTKDIVRGKEMVEEGKFLQEEAKSMPDKKLAALIEERGNKRIERGRELIEKGNALASNTKNDLWALGILMHEMFTAGENVPFIPMVIMEDKFMDEATAAALFKGPFAEGDRGFYIEKNVASYLTQKIAELQSEKEALIKERNCFEKTESQYNEYEEMIRDLEAEIDKHRQSIQNKTAAYDVIWMTSATPNDLILNWIAFFPQEAMDLAKKEELATTIPANHGMIELKYRMMRVDVREQPSAKELLEAYTAIHAENKRQNAGVETRKAVRKEAIDRIEAALSSQEPVNFNEIYEKLKAMPPSKNPVILQGDQALMEIIDTINRQKSLTAEGANAIKDKIATIKENKEHQNPLWHLDRIET